MDGRPGKRIKTERFELKLTPGVLAMLDALVDTELFGDTRQAVVTHLLLNSLRQLQVEGTLQRLPPST